MTVVLTSEEQADVLNYLGYTALGTNFDPMMYDSDTNGVVPWAVQDGQISLERNMGQVRDQYHYANIQAIIAKIKANRTRIECAADRLAVSSVETIRMNKTEISQLWTLDFQWCTELAVLMGMKVRFHPSMMGGYGMRATR